MPKPVKPIASYTPGAMRAEGAELGSLALMDKKIAADRAREEARMPPMLRTKPKSSAPAKAPKKMAKGGSASKRADGCATRGKTRGKMV